MFYLATLCSPIPWPPRSPDITPLDFFLWRYVKDIIYKTPVTFLDELKLELLLLSKQLHCKYWRTLGGKLNTA
jgi:hypothetical protein